MNNSSKIDNGSLARSESSEISHVTLANRNTSRAAVEQVILKRDLRSLTEVERVQYNFALCRSLGLNPLTNPIDYLVNDGKMTPYINAVGVAQLRAIHGISTKIVSRQTDKEFCYVTATATSNGRTEESTAIVAMTDKYGKSLFGQRKADKMMAAETKAKRRATLALVGIPWADGNNVMSSKTHDPSIDILQEIDDDPF